MLRPERSMLAYWLEIDSSSCNESTWQTRSLYESVCECTGLFAFTFLSNHGMLSYVAFHAADAFGLCDSQKHARISSVSAHAWILH